MTALKNQGLVDGLLVDLSTMEGVSQMFYLCLIKEVARKIFAQEKDVCANWQEVSPKNMTSKLHFMKRDNASRRGRVSTAGFVRD